MIKYYFDRGLSTSTGNEVSVETIAGVRKASVSRAGGEITGIRTGMGAPVFAPDDIPVKTGRNEGNTVDIKSMKAYSVSIGGKELPLNLLSMGNPHAVHFCQDPVAGFPLSRLGPEVERHEIFPNRTNFEAARVLDRGNIEARIWERGVGETLASGSGSCAVTVAAHMLGYVDNEVRVNLPGGTLEVEWDGTGEVFLGGPAETVFAGEWLGEDPA